MNFTYAVFTLSEPHAIICKKEKRRAVYCTPRLIYIYIYVITCHLSKLISSRTSLHYHFVVLPNAIILRLK